MSEGQEVTVVADAYLEGSSAAASAPWPPPQRPILGSFPHRNASNRLKVVNSCHRRMSASAADSGHRSPVARRAVRGTTASTVLLVCDPDPPRGDSLDRLAEV